MMIVATLGWDVVAGHRARGTRGPKQQYHCLKNGALCRYDC
jgi:hypothetical protein